MSSASELRTQVAGAYTDALADARQAIAPADAGYRACDLAAAPPEAAASSFGCGNPTAFADLSAGQVVVDLGSGAGLDLILAARKVGPGGRVIGVDMTDAMIERARAHAQESGLPNIEVRKGLIESLPVDSSSVDWVISNCVLNLSPEKERVFAEIARVLKPGGRMMVSDIVINDLPGWLRRSLGTATACVAGAISEQAFTAGLRQAGLVEVQVRERLVYDASQLAAIARELGPELLLPPVLRRDWVVRGFTRLLTRWLAGKVSSARFHACKPNQTSQGV